MSLSLLCVRCGGGGPRDAPGGPHAADGGHRPARDAGPASFGRASEHADCESCHEEIAREWAGSMHHHAFTSVVFQGEYAVAADPFCVGCHAPLADPERPSGPAAAAGITCAVCHVRGDAVVASRASGDAPHDVVVDEALSTERACARCHEFTFGRRSVFAADEMLQKTLREHAVVRERGPCQTCHMPRATDGHRTHAFPGARDPVLLGRALDTDVRAVSRGRETTVTIRLSPRDVAHAVPTGDMFRRLSVKAWLDRRPSTARERVLMRRFGVRAGKRREVTDDRVQPDAPRDVELVLPGVGRRVCFRVDWEALDPEDARRRALPREQVVRTISEGCVPVLAAR